MTFFCSLCSSMSVTDTDDSDTDDSFVSDSDLDEFWEVLAINQALRYRLQQQEHGEQQQMQQ